jgi:hypothetical protein
MRAAEQALNTQNGKSVIALKIFVARRNERIRIAATEIRLPDGPLPWHRPWRHDSAALVAKAKK